MDYSPSAPQGASGPDYANATRRRLDRTIASRLVFWNLQWVVPTSNSCPSQAALGIPLSQTVLAGQAYRVGPGLQLLAPLTCLSANPPPVQQHRQVHSARQRSLCPAPCL